MTSPPTGSAPSAAHERPTSRPTTSRARPPLELLVFSVGIATLGAEIAAARLMAPFFGASTIVWANTIAIVLVALSIGYWFGGRMADRRPNLPALCATVLIASVLMALVPFVAGPFLSLSVDAFDEYSVGTFAGSLFGVLVLVAVPVLMLGSVSPWAIRLKMHAVEDSGEMAGRMYAISTVGSLLGTFAAALLLIPLVGTQRTFLTFALITGVVAAMGLRARWWLVPVAIAALMAVPVGVIKGSETGSVLHEADTEYQYARVVRSAAGVRRLELNEGLAIHSLYRPGSYLTGGYWDAFLVDPLAVNADPPRHVAILGTAGGTTARAYQHFFPGTTVDAVEIDGELLDIGERYFDLRPGPRLRLHTADARPYLRATGERFDSIFLDTYRQPYIPFYLTTKEFFQLAHDRLNPGGSVLINVGHPKESDRLEKVLTATLGSVFKHVARDPVKPTNTILIGSDAEPSRATLQRGELELPGELRPLAGGAAARLAAPLQGGEVYTDDHAPVEWLVDASILQAAEDGP